MAASRANRRHWALVVALFLLFSLPGLAFQSQDLDVLLYAAAAARANAEGALPYSSAWIEKGPVAMGIYQLVFALAGPYNFLGLSVAWLALTAASAVLSALLARDLAGGRAALWTAALFALGVPGVAGTLNTEVPAATASIAALFVWCRSLGSSGEASGRLAAGALVGAAFLCRQNAGALWPVLLAGEASRWWWRDRSLGSAARSAALVTVGFLALPLATAGIYAVSGQFEPFFFCFYGYNAEIYVAATRLDRARLLASPFTALEHFFVPIPATALLGWIGAALAARDLRLGPADAGARRSCLLALLLAAFGLTASLFVGLRFFSHYFGLVLPFWAVLGGIGAEWARSRWSDRAAARPARFLLGAALVAVLAWHVGATPWRATAGQLRSWIRSGAILAPGDPLHWPGRDGFAARAARFIRERSAPSDRIFVWGMRPHVYVYAGRIPATRFVTCTFLTGLVPWERSAPEEDTTRWIVPGAWDLLMEDLERERPLFIVDASHDHLFGEGAYAPERYPPLARFLERGYEPVREWDEGDRMVVWRSKEHYQRVSRKSSSARD